MRTATMYRGLATMALGGAAIAAALAAVGLVLSQATSAGAAALCSVVLFVPGLAFFNYARRLRAREAALRHVADVVHAAGVADVDLVARELDVPPADAEKIVRRAREEGHLRGTLDDRGRVVADAAPRCPDCGRPVPAAAMAGPCPECGSPLPAKGG